MSKSSIVACVVVVAGSFCVAVVCEKKAGKPLFPCVRLCIFFFFLLHARLFLVAAVENLQINELPLFISKRNGVSKSRKSFAGLCPASTRGEVG
jgi:hypothetical protein